MESGNWSWKAKWKVMESLGASGCGRGISATVWSSALPSSGAMKRRAGGEVAVAVGVDVGERDAAALLGRVFVFGFAVADAAAGVGLAGEGGLGTEGVEIEVKRDGGEGLAGEIFVGEGFGGVE